MCVFNHEKPESELSNGEGELQRWQWHKLEFIGAIFQRPSSLSVSVTEYA